LGAHGIHVVAALILAAHVIGAPQDADQGNRAHKADHQHCAIHALRRPSRLVTDYAASLGEHRGQRVGRGVSLPDRGNPVGGRAGQAAPGFHCFASSRNCGRGCRVIRS
jgi:hypothetical protein